MKSFADLGLIPSLLTAVKELGFEQPTPIQEKTIPHLLSTKKDLIASAQTGTGKTAAFGLPAIQLTDIDDKRTQTLIICPTRELCLQIAKDLNNYAKYVKGLGVIPVYGGASIVPQMKALTKEAQIVVATPGRAKDLINRNKLKLNNIRRVILDEADEMLTLGFKEDLNAILAKTPEDKQTLLFSATISKEVKNITKKYMYNPVELAATSVNMGADNVEHIYYMVQARDKYELLKRIADMTPNIYGIVFCRTRRETKEIANKLIQDGYNADALHGELSQAQRDEVMGRFRKAQLQILVATDVAARGLDVNDLTHVINFNLPDDPNVYVHRSGRTGRAGKSGISIAIIHSREFRRIKDIERLSKIKFTKELGPSGKDICTKQLFSFINKIEKVEVDEKQIEPFLDPIYKKLEWLSREELIKHFVSLEFNKYLSYYKNSKDINISGSTSGNGGRDDRRSDRGNRDDRRSERRRDDKNSRNTRSNDKRGDRRDDRRNDKRNENFTRLFINIGSKNDLTPERLIGVINEGLNSGNSEIGKIEILKNFSFFEIENAVAPELIKVLNGHAYQDIPLAVEISQEKSHSGSGNKTSNQNNSDRKFRGNNKNSNNSANRKSGGGNKFGRKKFGAKKNERNSSSSSKKRPRRKKY